MSLRGVVYEVEAALVGTTVTLRFDPAGTTRVVQVWQNGRHVQDATPVDLYANCFVRRERPSRMLLASAPPRPPRPGLRLADLRDRRDDDDAEDR